MSGDGSSLSGKRHDRPMVRRSWGISLDLCVFFFSRLSRFRSHFTGGRDDARPLRSEGALFGKVSKDNPNAIPVCATFSDRRLLRVCVYYGWAYSF